MLDEIRKMMAEVLEVSSADVIRTRDALLAEQATEDARYAATTSLLHPEGSSTPIEEAYSRAQDRVARIRDQVEQVLPKAMALLMALEIAEQRRGEAKLHREQKWDSDWAKQATGTHAAARDWMLRLHRHGVHPHYLKQHSNETVAIIADLTIWKAKDAKFASADNPWRQVLGIYARRKINKPSRKGRKGGSTPGTPTPDRHNTGSGDYRFDEMVSAPWGVEVEGVAQLEPEAAPPSAQTNVDGMIDPEEGAAAGAEGHVRGGEDTLQQEVADADATRQGSAAEPPALIVRAARRDEYGQTVAITDEVVATLRSAAGQLADGDYDYWREGLEIAMGVDLRNLSDEEVIAKVEVAKQPDGVTPFHHFLKAARRDGKEAGLAAYREATIQRFMHMIATSPDFADVRGRLGLR